MVFAVWNERGFKVDLFKKFFKKSSKPTNSNSTIAEPIETALESKGVSVPVNHKLAMSKLGIDIQTVLLNADRIENKEIADLYATLISEKYGVKTKVSITPDKSSYLVFVYRIDLDVIDEFYDSITNRWIFSLATLQKLQGFNVEEAVKSAEVGTIINANLTREFQTNDDFTLLFDNPYYYFYEYFSQTLLRYEKQTEQTLVVGRFVNIAACIQYHNKLYIYETRGIIGDREIYQCDLNGSNLVALQCLSNEKIFRAGHFVSMDSVKEMHITGDSLEIVVMRNDGSSIFDYKIIITENAGAITLKQGF